MDFDLSDEQQATIDVAAKLLGDKSTPDAIRPVEQADDLRFDRDLWAAMADAGLLGIAVPAEHGGAGLGVLELAMVLEEVGRRTAPVPALATLALGALPVARFGTPEQQAALLPGVVAGTTVLTAALVEPLGRPGPAHHGDRRARRRRLGARRHAHATSRPGWSPTRSSCRPPTDGGDVALFLVPADAEGVGRAAPGHHLGHARRPGDADRGAARRRRRARSRRRRRPPCAGCSSTPPWPPAR